MIYVFKTTVKTKKEVKQLEPKLNEGLLTAKWNFDLDDNDKILRIDSHFEISEIAIKILKQNGFECEELND